jgi:hypothetical protein
MYYWIDDSGTFCVVEPWSGSSQGEVNIHTIMCFTSSLPLGPNQCDLIIYGPIGDPPGIVTIYVNVTPHPGFNYPPMYSNENPTNGTISVPISTSLLSIYIDDFNGDTFDWSIETSPNIGGSYGIGEINGTKTCNVSDLDYNTTYTWFVNATDISGSGETTSEFYTYTTESLENLPPDEPIISGPNNGSAGLPSTYNFMSTDPDNDDICYYIDWGDGTFTEWTNFQSQGQPGYNEDHTWSKGTYTIKAKAKDAKGNESTWSYFEITVPRTMKLGSLFLKLLERLQNMFPLLRYILAL